MSAIDVEKLALQHDRMLENIHSLVSRLRNALEAFSLPAAADRDNEVFRRRLAASTALKAVLDYLDAIGVGQIDYRLCEPLVELFAALEDAAIGIGNPILKPEKRKQRGVRMPLYEALVWTRAVAATTALMATGDSQPAALQRMAPVTSRALGKRVTTTQLRDMRKRMTSGRVPADVAAEYRRHLKAIRNAKALTARAQAERAVEFLEKRRKAK